MSQGYLVQIIYTLYWNIQVCVYYSRDFAYFLVEGGGGGGGRQKWQFCSVKRAYAAPCCYLLACNYIDLSCILVKIDMQEQQVNCGC